MQDNGQGAEMIESADVEVVSGNALTAMVHAETDVQIATAKRFPRVIATFLKAATSMAIIDEETAASCFFVLPPRDGKKISGPSVRLAEIVASAWGNLRSASRIIDDDGKMVTAQGVCWDLERNNFRSAEVMRRVTKKNGQRYSDDMVIMTCNAASAIAFRNAVFSVVPRSYVKQIENAARKVAIGDATTLAAKRHECIAYFAKMGIDEKRVLAAVEKKGVEDIGLEELATLKGMATAIKDGELSLDTAFPETRGDAIKERLAAPLPGNGSDKKKAPLAEGELPADDPHATPVMVEALRSLILKVGLNEQEASKLLAARGVKKLDKATREQCTALEADLQEMLTQQSTE